MLSKPEIEQIKERIVNEVRPRRLYLFGSYAENRANSESDIDIFVEIADGYDIISVKQKLNKLFLDRKCPMDFVVETTEIVKKSMENDSSFFNNIIREKAKILYEENG